MSTSVAITAMNASFAAQAQTAADEAHRDRCKIEIGQFNAQTPTVPAMQSYASCVDFVYPTETHSEHMAMRIGVGVTLLLIIVGFIVGWKSEGDWTDAVALAFGGLMVGLVGFLLFLALAFVF